MPLVGTGLAWAFGVYLGGWAAFPWWGSALFVGALVTAFALRRRSRAAFWLLCLAVLFAGLLRVQLPAQTESPTSLVQPEDGSKVWLTGVVVADPEPRAQTTVLRLDRLDVEDEGGRRAVSGAALVYAPRFPPFAADRGFPYYRYGDLLRVEGRLETLDGGSDWGERLANDGITTVVRYPGEVSLLAEGRGAAPLSWLYQARNRLAGSLQEGVPEPQASLAEAVLLGRRGNLPYQTRDDFVRAGTAHLLAVSGLHVGIVASVLLGAGVWLLGRKRPTYFLVALAGVWLYVLLTGGRPPALRAGIMGSLWLLALYLGRQRSGLTALVLAAAVMVGLDPPVLRSVSFQLSFAAMAGLVFLTPPLVRAGRRALGPWGEGTGVRSQGALFVVYSLAATLGAVLATLPLLAFHFKQVSLMSLPASFFALPAVPGLIVTSALASVAGIIWMPLGQVLGWVVWLFAAYIIKVTEVFASVPFAAISVERGGAALVWGYYALLGAVLWLGADGRRRSRLAGLLRQGLARLSPASGGPPRWVFVPALVVAVLVWVATVTAPDGRLHVYFLDVGQGDAILISKGSQQVLVDGGPGAEAIATELGDKLPFWDRTIELVVLTHPDADHLTGLPEVLRRYRVGQVLTSGQDSREDVYAEWLRLLADKKVKETAAKPGQLVEMGGGVRLEVLHPPADLMEDTGGDVNNNSVVLRLVWGDASFLLTGDLAEEGERYLIGRGADLRSAVLKVGHHGSASSTSAGFLEAVGPEVAVISVGVDNGYGHPNPGVMERLEGTIGGERVYLTSESGTVEISTDGERMWVRTER